MSTRKATLNDFNTGATKPEHLPDDLEPGDLLEERQDGDTTHVRLEWCPLCWHHFGSDPASAPIAPHIEQHHDAPEDWGLEPLQGGSDRRRAGP